MMTDVVYCKAGFVRYLVDVRVASGFNERVQLKGYPNKVLVQM